MKIAVSSSFEQLMGRVDCEVYIDSCYLARLDENMPEESLTLSNPKKDVKIGACGIWEKDTKKLKLCVRIPEDSMADSQDEFKRQEYAAIYFFSSREDQGGATFAIYDYENNAYNDLGLSLGRNLVDIDFPAEFLGRISLADTSLDTEFLETFGQYPGKNIHITGNEDTIVAKKTYYQYWQLEVTKDRKTTDLPLLDEYGKMIVSNYRYRTYSNLNISTPGLLRNFNPPTRFGLSDSGGSVSIIGTADFIEYSVWGDKIKEELRGRTTIDSIPGSEIVYISGHNDSGVAVGELQNIFTIDNYSSLIDYSPKEIVSSYGADGIFGLRVTYYDVKEEKPVTIVSGNQIQLARRKRSDSWFIVSSSTRYTEYTSEFGEVPVFLFPYNTDGTGYFTIRTRFPVPISDLSQLQVSFEDQTIETLFSVSLNLEPFVDQSGVYYVDIKVTLRALTENLDEHLWAPIISGASKLVYTKISYQDYFEVFYMVQCPKIDGESLKLVDAQGTTINEVVLNYGSGSNKTYYLVADPETTDLGERNGWRILDADSGIVFSRSTGLLSGTVQPSYTPENTMKVSYAPDSNTAQDIILPDIVIARLKEQGLNEDLGNTNNWRVMVDIVQIHVGFRKIGQPIVIQCPSQIETDGIGLYEFDFTTNCRFTLETNDTNYDFKEKYGSANGNPLSSPSYNDQRYENGGTFEYWLRKTIVTALTQTTLSPITILAREGDRALRKTIVVNQNLVPTTIYKLNESGEEYSFGSWEYIGTTSELARITGRGYTSRDWIKLGDSKLEIGVWDSAVTYYKGDVVRTFLGNYETITTGTITQTSHVYFDQWRKEWWIYLGSSSTGLPPSFDDPNFKNVTQYFLSIADNNTGNSITLNNRDSNPYWREISWVDTLDDMEDKTITISNASTWSPYRLYWVGDIVKYRASNLDPYSYYIATKSVSINSGSNVWNIGLTPASASNSDWWKNIDGCNNLSDIGEGEQVDGAFYRTVLVKEVNIPYTYTKFRYYTRPGYEDTDLDENYAVRYLLLNPSRFTAGTSLQKIVDGVYPIALGYSYTTKDSAWTELGRLEDLIKVLGDTYLDKYFYDNSSNSVFNLNLWNNLVKYSAKYSQVTGRQVYMASEYEIYSDLSEVSLDNIPFLGSINNLPSISILPVYSSSFRRIEDAGVMKVAKLNEDLTNLKGEWSGSTLYSGGDIVYKSLSEGYLYFKKTSTAFPIVTQDPETDTTGTDWEPLTWTVLDPTVTNNIDAIEATRIALGLSSSSSLSVIDTYTQSNNVNYYTRNILQREPVPGEIVKVGSRYYYCGAVWSITGYPSTGNMASYTLQEVSDLSDAPNLEDGYTSVAFKYTVDDTFYVSRSIYVFNNIAYNRYVFVPQYSDSSTQIKYFSRKTPEETLTTRDQGANIGTTNNSLVISQYGYPMFNEYENNDSDHYIFHTLGLSYNHVETLEALGELDQPVRNNTTL